MGCGHLVNELNKVEAVIEPTNIYHIFGNSETCFKKCYSFNDIQV